MHRRVACGDGLSPLRKLASFTVRGFDFHCTGVWVPLYDKNDLEKLRFWGDGRDLRLRDLGNRDLRDIRDRSNIRDERNKSTTIETPAISWPLSRFLCSFLWIAVSPEGAPEPRSISTVGRCRRQ